MDDFLILSESYDKCAGEILVMSAHVSTPNVDLFEVRMSCRFVSSSMFRCHP